MAWQSGPLESWFDIHEAIKKEFPRLRKMAANACLEDTDSLKTLSDEVVFFAEVLTVHSLSEDGVGFPIMRARGISVPKALGDDHHRELAALYDIRRACLELLFHEDGQDLEAALATVRGQLAALEEDLAQHIAAEDDVVIPQAMEAFSPAEQAQLVVKMVAHTPAWLSEKVLPWMITNISAEHRTHLLAVWMENLAREPLIARVRVIKAGVSAELWAELKRDVPGLVTLAP
ncbi:MAG: hemerythrin domain-containing protein [Pseudomonadota bacterium]